jgi:hypothetical protein
LVNIINLLNQYDIDIAIEINSLNIIFYLSSEKIYRSVIYKNKGIQILLKRLKLFEDDTKELICNILIRMMHDELFLNEIVDLKGFDVLLKMINEDKDTDTMAYFAILNSTLFDVGLNQIEKLGITQYISENLQKIPYSSFDYFKKIHFLNKIDIDDEEIDENKLVFGQSIREVEKNSGIYIPPGIQTLLDFLEGNCQETSGIFREKGDEKDIEYLIKTINYNKKISDEFLKKENIHSMAAVVLYWIKQMPEPLLTFNAFDNFIEVTEIKNVEERVNELKQLMDYLPNINYSILSKLISLFYKITKNKKTTNMSPFMISIIFGVYFLRVSSDPIKQALNYDSINKLTELLIKHYEELFIVNRLETKSSFKKILTDILQNNNETDTSQKMLNNGISKKDLIKELYESEKTYLENIFKNMKTVKQLDIIYFINSYIFKYIENEYNNENEKCSMGELFVKFIPLFRIYKIYLSKYKEILDTKNKKKLSLIDGSESPRDRTSENFEQRRRKSFMEGPESPKNERKYKMTRKRGIHQAIFWEN